MSSSYNSFPNRNELQEKIKTWDLVTVRTCMELVTLPSHYSHQLCFKAILSLIYWPKIVFMLAPLNS